MPSPIYRLLEPALNTAPDLDLALTGSIGDRVQANPRELAHSAPATNPGMLGIFNPSVGPFRTFGTVGWRICGEVSHLRRPGPGPDSEHRARIRRIQFITQLIATQGADGSLGLPLQRDLWGQYHVILGLLRWYERTGDNNSLNACLRAADLVCARYFNRTSAIATDDPADAEKNQTIAHALVLLYEFTGRDKYLQLGAPDRIRLGADQRSNNFLANALAGGAFHAGNRPRWETLHDVQAIAELYYVTGQPSYRQAFEQIWAQYPRLGPACQRRIHVRRSGHGQSLRPALHRDLRYRRLDGPHD